MDLVLFSFVIDFSIGIRSAAVWVIELLASVFWFPVLGEDLVVNFWDAKSVGCLFFIFMRGMVGWISGGFCVYLVVLILQLL